jgi:hypothetical protein
VHGYLRGWGTVGLMNMDLVSVYPSKPASLSSLKLCLQRMKIYLSSEVNVFATQKYVSQLI